MATNEALLRQLAQVIGRLDMIQREQQKHRNVMAQHETRITNLESDVADALPPASEDEKEVPNIPMMSLKRRFQGKFAVADADGNLLTEDLSLEAAQEKLNELRQKGLN